MPGDVRDESLLKNLFETHKPAWVLHAAAHKHVALMEDGTYILAKTAAAYNVERFLFISTDKAVRTTSVMGASKRLGEMGIGCFNCPRLRKRRLLDGAFRFYIV